MVAVASFYSPRPAQYPDAPDYRPLLALLDKSCRRLGLDHFCITDVETARTLPCNTFAAQLPEMLMPAFFAGQSQFLRAWAPKKRPAILVGADCLMVKDPTALFDGRWDLMVTNRRHKRWPINTGAVYVPAGSMERVADLYARMASVCGPEWGDDQITIARMLGPVPEDHGVYNTMGLRVNFVPMAEFNHTPKTADQASDSYVVHFKGRRKALMPIWAEAHLGIV